MDPINHADTKLCTALGLSEDFVSEVDAILDDFFMNKTQDGPGHGKASASLVEAIALAKKKVFNDAGPVQEYEATLVYLAYLIGAGVADHKHRLRSHPIVAMLGDEIQKRSNVTVVKCDSPLEVDLHKSIMEELAQGNMEKALESFMTLKDLKDRKGKGDPKNKPE